MLLFGFSTSISWFETLYFSSSLSWEFSDDSSESDSSLSDSLFDSSDTLVDFFFSFSSFSDFSDSDIYSDESLSSSEESLVEVSEDSFSLFNSKNKKRN